MFANSFEEITDSKSGYFFMAEKQVKMLKIGDSEKYENSGDDHISDTLDRAAYNDLSIHSKIIRT